MYSLLQRLKSIVNEIIQSRVLVLIAFFCLTSVILVGRVFFLQIVKGQEYFDNYKLQIQKTKQVDGTRGNIYDRNGQLLAYNDLAYAVTIEDNGEYDTRAQKNLELNKIISTVIDLVEANGDSIVTNFGVILDNDNVYQYIMENKTQKLRFIADVYGQATIDKLTPEQQNQTAEELIEHLCSDELGCYGIDSENLTKEEVLKIVNIRYAISLNSYQKYLSTTIASDVCDKTVADVMENMDTLQGVDVAEESIRRYPNAKCFANIIGYIGQISVDEYDALTDEQKKDYTKNDKIGKSGLEKEFDSVLRGKKGDVKIYVNNVGKVIDSVPGKDPEAGNDIYLSIDADLQVAAYNILEQEIAGIVLSKLTPGLEFDRSHVSDGSEVKIPIGDVYDTFFSNNILDINHMSGRYAGPVEKEVYKTFSAKKEQIMKQLESILLDPNAAAYRDLSQEYQTYLTYIDTDYLTNTTKILMSDQIDKNDKMYKNWHKFENINIYSYLNYAISKNWIDTTKLKDYMPEEGAYSDASEAYEALVHYILDRFQKNNNFDKLIFKYMIRNKDLGGRNICAMLYEQEVLKMNKSLYNSLKAGKMGGYDFIRTKMESLEITPGMLGLEPCTGSLVMTDTNTGELLACVSYPGYDNNKLTNSTGSSYYNKLVMDKARPFYNNATQEKTAPGSTYKPLVSVAGLTEGVIDVDSYINCNGEYTKVEPPPKCWAYPSAHGGLTVAQAIEHSCNCFFYEVGFRLSLQQEVVRDNKITGDTGGFVDETANTTEESQEDLKTVSHFSSTYGTERLGKYAEMFGFGDITGLEIPESEPQISDASSVPSAIGQGTNNYTTSQIARYVNAIANRGTVYNLTLLDKITDTNGKVLETFKPTVKNQITDIPDTTWNAVHEGMRRVVTAEHNDVFLSLNHEGLELSGKTGTAQQSKTHADHGLFIGFAPSSNPEVSFAVRIAYGYSSSRAAEVGRDVMKYYYNLEPKDKIITGKAAQIKGKSATGD